MGAPVITSRKLSEDLYTATYAFTGSFTDTQETEETKVVASDLRNIIAGATPLVSIEYVEYNVTDGVLNVLFDADSPTLALALSGTSDLHFSEPLTNNAGAGVTGDILFTTEGITGSYQVIMRVRKEPACFNGAPTMTDIAVTDEKAGVYVEGDTFTADCTFDQPVFVQPGATLTLDVDGTEVNATVTDGDGTDTITFAYTFGSESCASSDFHITHVAGLVGSDVGQLPVEDHIADIDTSSFTVND